MMTKHVLLLLLVLLSPRHNALDVATTRVAVTVTRSLPSILPAEAKAAWLKYAWKEGGGLPAVGSLVSDDGRERTLLPLFLREKLVERKGDYNNNHGDDDDDDTCDTTSVEYVLTSAGALSVDVVAASHEGRVTFAPTTSGSGTDLTWSVGFDCTARDWLWEAVTRYTVGTVASNLEALCATPLGECDRIYEAHRPAWLPTTARPRSHLLCWGGSERSTTTRASRVPTWLPY